MLCNQQSNKSKRENRKCARVGCVCAVCFEIYYGGAWYYSCGSCLGSVILTQLVFDPNDTFSVQHLGDDDDDDT